MAYVVRLIGAVLLMLCGSAALAVIPVTSQTQYRATGDYPWLSDQDAACSMYTAEQSLNNSNFLIEFLYVTARECHAKYTERSSGSVVTPDTVIITLATRVAAVCPANSTQNGETCVCDVNYQEGTGAQAGQCVAPPDECQKLAGSSAGQKSWQRGTGDAPSGATSTFMCGGDWSGPGAQKCVIKVDSDISYKDQGIWWATGTGYYTGATASSCNGDGGTGDSPLPSVPKQPDNPNPSPTPAAAAPAPCPAGQAPGDVNGTRICAPTGNDKPTSAPAPGNGSSEVKKPDGSSVTTTQSGETQCNAGTCTTTTTNNTVITNKPGDTSCPQGATQGTTTKDGQTVTTCSSSSTSTSTGSQAGFCKDNPSSKQCGSGQGSSFGGNCQAGFKAASEDAVLNAMAEEQYRRNCQVLATEGAAQTEIATEMAKTGNQTGDNPNNSSVSIGGGNIDTSDALGGGGCSLNKQITVRGFTATLPFGDMLCSPLQAFGLLLVGVAMLLAGRIVTRG